LGWGAALRVSELVGLDLEDLAMYGDPDTGTGGGVYNSLCEEGIHLDSCQTR